MKMSVEERNGVTVLKPEIEELDFKNTVWLRGELYDLLKNDQVKVLLDLINVSMISGYTVGVFLAFARNFRDEGGDLRFLNLQERVKCSFEAARINYILEIFGDEEKAVQSFSEGK